MYSICVCASFSPVLQCCNSVVLLSLFFSVCAGLIVSLFAFFTLNLYFSFIRSGGG